MIIFHQHAFLITLLIVLVILIVDSFQSRAWIALVCGVGMFIGTFVVKLPVEVTDMKHSPRVIKISIVDLVKNQYVKTLDNKVSKSEEKTEECTVGYWVIPGKSRGYKPGVQLNKYVETKTTTQIFLDWDKQTFALTNPYTSTSMNVTHSDCIEEKIKKGK